MNKEIFFEALKVSIERSYDFAVEKNLPFPSIYGFVIDTLLMEFVAYTIFNNKINHPEHLKETIDLMKERIDFCIQQGIREGESLKMQLD